MPPETLTVTDVETTLNVMHQSMTEIDDETAATSAFVSSIKNAAGRLQELRRELAAK
jgi:truncated hemoglobin YjbI